MKAKVDRDLCIGVGNCIAVAPSVFQLNPENKAVVLDAGSVDAKKLIEAAESCPVQAITVENEEGEQVYP